jgi:heme exporter protein CcmD
MSHTPFIIAAYAITTALLVWCALTPLVQGKKLKQIITRQSLAKGEDDASGT